MVNSDKLFQSSQIAPSSSSLVTPASSEVLEVVVSPILSVTVEGAGIRNLTEHVIFTFPIIKVISFA